MGIIRCLGMLIWGVVIFGLIYVNFICEINCKSPYPPSMRIVGWNCNDLIYEDAKGQTYERGLDGHYIVTGKTINEKGD